MKLLLLSAIFAIGTFFSIVSDTAGTTKYYILYANGEQGKVTLSWKNIRGLGVVEGLIEGNPMIGKNTRPGKLQLRCEGIYIELSKVREGKTFQWKGIGYNGNDCSEFAVSLVPTNQLSNQSEETERPNAVSPFGGDSEETFAGVFAGSQF